MNKIRCDICPHFCNLEENQIGICRGRSNINGQIVSINYGLVTSIALDPIEKKPLKRFYSGSKILSVGSFGCNLKCPFCQNYEISMSNKNDIKNQYITPENLIQIATDLVKEGNIGIAYTYNEPLIGYEYVRDCAVLAKENNLKNVVVTNGCFLEEPMKELLPYIDAFNIDLKGFTEEFYRKIGGDLETVKNFIKLAAKYSHIEVTTLIIPDENDSKEEIQNISSYLSSIDKNIPLHISRFFPTYQMMDKNPTRVDDIYNLTKVAKEYLTYVYEGNV